MLGSSIDSSRLQYARFWTFAGLGVGAALLAGYLIGVLGVLGAVVTILVPVLLLLLTGVLLSPRFGLFLYVQLSYCTPVISHFLPVESPIPLGTLIEGILVLTMLSVVLNGKDMDWNRLKNPAFYLVMVWFIFTCLQYFNPETPDRASWLYRFRSISFQWLVAALLVSVVPLKGSDVRVLIGSWFFWSVLAALWGFRQQYIGLTDSEMFWLINVGATTHLLFGYMRSWSFFSDAAQLGAEMAGATLVALVLFLESRKWVWSLLFLLLTGVFFWGFAVSSTRSALFVMLGGFPVYLVMKRNVRRLIISGGLAVVVLAFLLFTSVGNSNYQIYRIRTALHPTEDPSFMLRIENQKKLAERLKPLPFGVGLGTSSLSGVLFNPGHWAGQIQPDSAYVIVWIETGAVGLGLYLFVVLSILGIGAYRVWHLPDGRLKVTMIALLAQSVGITLMAYSNTITGQFPTSTMLFISMFLFTTCHRFND
jgi:putative inorganic carbon (hco3(-)) transporter